MLAGIILFVIYFIFAFFTGGEVPVPKIEMPAMPEMPTFNAIKNRMNNAVNNIGNNTSKRSENTRSNANNTMSRSLFETI
jgi:hypothetical protein